ncbi:ATP-binding cassette domain-containing protein, partial [Staphylococcus haemolyticus]
MANTNVKEKELAKHTDQSQESISTVVSSNEVKHNKESDSNKKVVYSTQNLDLWYGDTHALQNINLDILENNVTAIIGPSGCGKSTYIKTLNRMVELVPSVKTAGK